jgi:hypothetical protein
MATGVVLFHRPSQTSPNCPCPSLRTNFKDERSISHWSRVLCDKPAVTGFSTCTGNSFCQMFYKRIFSLFKFNSATTSTHDVWVRFHIVCYCWERYHTRATSALLSRQYLSHFSEYATRFLGALWKESNSPPAVLRGAERRQEGAIGGREKSDQLVCEDTTERAPSYYNSQHSTQYNGCL